MPACKLNRLVSAYHDGELATAERLHVEAHLGQCSSCTRELERLRGLSRLLGSAVRPAMPAGLLSRLHSHVGSTRDTVLLHMGQALAAAAAAVLVACAVWFWQGPNARMSRTQPDTLWETAAVTPSWDTVLDSGAEPQLAQWIVEDLSRENGNGYE